MLVLLDNDVPYGLRRLMRPNVCFHAKQMDWTTLQNGALLRAAEGRKFDVMVTADKGIFYQQNHAERRIALVQLTTPRWEPIKLAYHEILAAVEASSPGSFIKVEIPIPPRSTR